MQGLAPPCLSEIGEGEDLGADGPREQFHPSALPVQPVQGVTPHQAESETELNPAVKMPRFTATRDALYSLLWKLWLKRQKEFNQSFGGTAVLAAPKLWVLWGFFFPFSLLPALLGPFLLNANMHYFVRDKLSWLNFNNWIITNISCEELLQVWSLWNWANRQVPDQKRHTSPGLTQGTPSAFKWLLWGSAVPVIQAGGTEVEGTRAVWGIADFCLISSENQDDGQEIMQISYQGQDKPLLARLTQKEVPWFWRPW